MRQTSLLYRLFNSEIPDIHIPGQYALLERSALVLFNLTYSTCLILSYPSSFIGFGLGDGYSPALIWSFFESLGKTSPYLLYGGLALLLFNFLFRIQVMIRGQLAFKTNDPRLPPRTLLLYAIANGLNILFIVTVCLLAAAILYGLGYDFNYGLNLLEHAYQLAESLAQKIPTLVQLPYVLTFFVVFLIHGFFHYWIHRLCHMNRFLWLVLHRFHHMPTTLTNASTTVVIISVPFFIFMLLPKVFIYSALSKLFYPEPLLMEMFFFSIILWIPDPYAHQTALYKEALRSKFIRAFSFFATSQGVYHYLHHTNDPELTAKNKTNLINIGGGIFHIWDIVFKTYHPLTPVENKTPPIGLWGNPKLHHNPVRLLLSGLYQIVFEIKHNKGLKAKLMCVFGSTAYSPEITRSYHVSEGK